MLMRREHERMTGAASAVLGGTLVVAALAHATDGFTDSASRALPSTIMGLIAGVALLVAAFGLLSHRVWGYRAGVAAHVLAITLVLVAMFSLAAYGASTSMVIPGVLLVMLVLNAFALFRARPRNPLRRVQHEIAAKMY